MEIEQVEIPQKKPIESSWRMKTDSASSVSLIPTPSSSAAESKEPRLSPSRKIVVEDFQKKLIDGIFRQEKINEAFFRILDEKGLDTGYEQCRKCCRVVSSISGGHKTAHRYGKCIAKNKVYEKRKISVYEKNIINGHIVNYVMRSGVSFNHLESFGFRDLIKNILVVGSPELDVNTLKLPSAELIREKVEESSRVIVTTIAEEIKEPVARKEACLVLDYGKKVHNFLSVFIAYVDSKSEEPRVKVKPFGFIPVVDTKTTENTMEHLVAAGERLGLRRDAVLGLKVVADGAANMKKLDVYFESHTLCACHSIQKAAERTLDPLKETRKKLTSEELQIIGNADKAVDLCGNLAVLIRRRKNLLNLQKLPTAYCKTRWLTFMTCVQDIISMFSDIEKCTDPSIVKLRESVELELPLLMSILSIVKQFEHPLKIFEKTDAVLHEVAPVMFHLQKQFSQLANSEKGTDTVRAISKSAFLSITHYIDETVGEIHLLSTFLCPGMKSLQSLPSEYREKTLSMILEQAKRVAVPNLNDDEDFAVDRFGLYDSPVVSSTAESEIEEYRTMKVNKDDCFKNPLDFWKKNESRFPRLTKIAFETFCVLASETCCERAFSALNRVFRSDRHSLDPEFSESLMISFLYLNDYS